MIRPRAGLLAFVLACGPGAAAWAQDTPAAPPAAGQPSTAGAPDTREAALLELRRAKAGLTAPYEASGLEKGIIKIENERVLEGWLNYGPGGRYYIRFGGITTGAGFAVGPGLRLHRLANGRLNVDAFAIASHRRYLLAEGSVTAPRLAGGHARAGALARRKYFPQEDFFGIGPDAPRPQRVSFKYEENAFGAFAGARIASILDLEGRVEYLQPAVGEGTDSLIPSIGDLFTDGTAPGLAGQPDFLLARLSADYNGTTPAGNPRSGGRYMASVSRYSDRDTGRYSFNRLDLDLRQYVPFLQARRVLAFRALASFSGTEGDAIVPFYFQRTLGGGETLRGFRDFRFRDRNLLLFQAEYRWEVFPALDAALFYDAGKVAPSADGLDLDDLESDYGFGFRFGTNRGVFLRIDAAFGSRDGRRLFIKWSNVF